MFDEAEFPGALDWLSEETYNLMKEKTMAMKKKNNKKKEKKKAKKKTIFYLKSMKLLMN